MWKGIVITIIYIQHAPQQQTEVKSKTSDTLFCQMKASAVLTGSTSTATRGSRKSREWAVRKRQTETPELCGVIKKEFPFFFLFSFSFSLGSTYCCYVSTSFANKVRNFALKVMLLNTLFKIDNLWKQLFQWFDLSHIRHKSNKRSLSTNISHRTDAVTCFLK